MQTYIKILLFIILLSPLCVIAKLDIGQQRELFSKLENELKQGKADSFIKHRHELQNYVLKPYLDYLYLLNRLENVRGKDLNAFLRRHDNWPFVRHLRSEYIKSKAKLGSWSDVNATYISSRDTSINCYGLTAKYLEGGNQSWSKEGLQIWLNGNSQPSACDRLFKSLETEGHITSSMLWRRIKLAFENDNLGLVNYLAKKLPEDDKEIVKYWIRAHSNPDAMKSIDFSHIKHPAIIEILVHTIEKMAKRSPKDAVNIWRQVSKQYDFNHRHWSTVVRAIAVELALDNHHQSSDWLSKIPKNYINNTVSQLKLRTALRNYDWETVLETYDELNEEAQEDEKWIYWRSVALEMTGDRDQSQKLLLSLSHTRSYYGFMASQRVLRPYAIKNQSLSVPNEVIQKVENNQHILRALEWKVLEKDHLANQEWYYFLSTATEVERHASAAIAAKNNHANWAILALANSKDKNNLELRFPRKYADEIHRQADMNGIDPAWIFAVTRQESAFIPKATSSAGALGLMQLIPSTAKMVAKEAKVSYQSKLDLFDTNKNITLGSKYLRILMDDYEQNQILATASYNAGPYRVKQWLPEKDMPADVWIETIPYSETRNYVQNVIAYTLIYQQLLGRKPTFHKNIRFIPAKNITVAKK